ncbi:hypothetical protein Q0F98_25880 [Paenibacillus amylolyticus]|nr:hypothetical protein Q0F98_25880 [Paenibacillus amylolyticus]
MNREGHLKSEQNTHSKLQNKRGWKVLMITLGACVILSACGNSNSITSDQAEQQSAEEASNNEASENSNQEQNSSSEVSTMVTPDNFIDTLMNGSKDAIYNQFSPELKGTLTLEQFKEAANQFLEGVESWELVVDAQMNQITEHSWKDQTGTKGVQVYFSEENQIEGLLIQPLETYEDTDSKFTKTEFQFPMKGEWFVFWGGNDVLSNYHYRMKPSATPWILFVHRIIQVIKVRQRQTKTTMLLVNHSMQLRTEQSSKSKTIFRTMYWVS